MAAGESDIGSPRKAGDRSMVELVVYPGAYHAFDDPRFKAGIRVEAHWLQYNDAATQDAINHVCNFFERTLARSDR